jgi:hypothetical protein
MLSVIGAVLVWLPALVGLGSIMPLPADPRLRRGAAGILGLGVLGVLAMVVHFFVPLAPLACAGLWAAGVWLTVLRRRQLREGLSLAEIAGAGLALALALYWYQAPRSSYDSGLYYLQTVRWMTEHPLRLGLGNLHGRLAFDSLWLAVAGAVELPLLSGRSHAFVNVFPLVFVGALAGTGLWRLVSGERSLAAATLALLFPVLGHATGGLGASSPDQVAEILVALALALCIQALGREDRGFAEDFGPAVLVAFLAVLVKLSAAPVMAAPLCALVLRRRAVSVRSVAGWAIPCIAATVVWCLRTLLLSGCAVYPLAWTCVPSLPWSIPLDRVHWESDIARAWARVPRLPPADVLSGWGWLPRWAAEMAPRSDVRMFGAMAALGVVLVAWLRPRCAAVWIALGAAALGVVFVFLSAPDPRFAFGFLQALGLVPLAAALARLPVRGKVLAGALILAATAALTLRWARIGHFRSAWRIDPVEFPLPPAAEVVEQVNGLGIRAWVPARGDQCWDAPIPCAPVLHDSLVETGRAYAIRRAP